MRRLLAFALAATALASPALAAERSFSVTDFSKIRVDGPYRVMVTTGVAPYARASGASDAINDVSIEMLGQTLVVRKSLSSWGGYPGQSPGPVDITIGTHDLSTAWLNGSDSLSIDSVRGQSFDLSVQGAGSASVGTLAVDTLRVGITGSGSATAGGKTNDANVIVRGTGMFDGTYLIAKDASVGAEGSAVVKLNALGTAKVDTNGTSTIELGGRPACTVHAAGSAVVSGCR